MPEIFILFYLTGSHFCISDPVQESKLGVNRSMITNEQVDSYNKVALDVL